MQNAALADCQVAGPVLMAVQGLLFHQAIISVPHFWKAEDTCSKMS